MGRKIEKDNEMDGEQTDLSSRRKNGKDKEHLGTIKSKCLERAKKVSCRLNLACKQELIEQGREIVS